MNYKKSSILAITLFVFLGTVSGFTADLEPIDRQAKNHDPAEFSLNVYNNYSQNLTFQINNLRAPNHAKGWIDYPRYLEVKSGERKSFPIVIDTPENSVQASYQFSMDIRTYEFGEARKVSDYFSVTSDKDVAITSFNISKRKADPGEEVSSSITLRNTAPRSITDFDVRAEFLNQTESKSDYKLPSGAELSHEFSINVPENARPGDSKYELILEGEEFYQNVSRMVEIGEIRDIKRSKDSRNFVFYRTEEVSAVNKGNSEVSTQLNASFPNYLTALTEFSSEPDRIVEQNGRSVYVWNVELRPDQSETVGYTVRYWIPLIVLVVLIGVFFLLKKLRKPIKIVKNVESGKKGVKVIIEIENKSSHQINSIQIKDYVPDIASLDRDFEMAAPVVRRTKDYTELEWDIESMQPGEQRVLEYIINPAVVAEGKVTLPPAEVYSEGKQVIETDESVASFDPE